MLKSIIKIVFLALFSLFLTLSCVTSKKCIKKFPPSSDTIRITHTKDSIVIKDTTIYISLPGEIIRDSIPIPCPDPGPAYIPKKVYAETSLAKASAWWSYPVIKLELIQKDTTIEKRLAGAIREAYHWKTLYEKLSIRPAPVKYVPGVYKVAFWLWLGVILAILGFLIIKYGKKILPL